MTDPTDRTDMTPDYDDDPDSPRPIDRRVLLVGLGALTGLAILLAFASRFAASRQPGQTINPGIVDGDWQASLEHLAAAFEVRLQGIEVRLDDLAGMRVAGQTAAPSMPPNPIVPGASTNGESSMQHPDVGAMEPPPPAPAAVSLPPADVPSN